MINSNLTILVANDLYIKDPNSSELGKKILKEGLVLLDEMGLEDFTFKKLALKIKTTESTIYRYFESKNQFLFYLFNYYWSWMEYNLHLCITNLTSPKTKLRNVVKLLTKTLKNSEKTTFINECILQRVLMLELSKTFLSKKVEEENKLGYFKQYKRFVNLLSEIVLEINPKYPYPHTIISTLIESVFHQRFFAKHLPSLTDDLGKEDKLEDFFYQMTVQTIFNYNKNGKN
ncbi:MAG: TetR/AcrR family transcriptional regulator [Flavobacteriia bacterium]|nr:TetR/AcrR family transcriptional regulator [Flavobacteriia bacterium]